MKCLLVTVVLLGAACRTIATREVSSTPAPDVRVGTRARTWEVRCAGATLGTVVLFQDRGRVRDSVYVVRNAWNQDLGLVDGLGRAYRYVPHEEEPAWVGSGTIAVGAERILGASAACELIEVEEAASGPTSGPNAPALGEPAATPAGHASELPAEPAPAVGLPQSR